MAKKTQETNEPKFPYTTVPNVLRKLLTEIPKRPKPPKLTLETLKAWGVSSDGNARSAIRVLKAIGLLGGGGEPINDYVEFMKSGSGPALLAKKIRESYKALFESALEPQNESDDKLRNLFNIHSGGKNQAMRLQVQTFKTLCEHANFSDASTLTQKRAAGDGAADGSAALADQGKSQLPPVQVDLHIHLPENKTTRDYEAIIQDIAKYIYGRNIE